MADCRAFADGRLYGTAKRQFAGRDAVENGFDPVRRVG